MGERLGKLPICSPVSAISSEYRPRCWRTSASSRTCCAPSPAGPRGRGSRHRRTCTTNVPSDPRSPSGEAAGSYRYTRLSVTSSRSMASKCGGPHGVPRGDEADSGHPQQRRVQHVCGRVLHERLTGVAPAGLHDLVIDRIRSRRQFSSGAGRPCRSASRIPRSRATSSSAGHR